MRTKTRTDFLKYLELEKINKSVDAARNHMGDWLNDEGNNFVDKCPDGGLGRGRHKTPLITKAEVAEYFMVKDAKSFGDGQYWIKTTTTFGRAINQHRKRSVIQLTNQEPPNPTPVPTNALSQPTSQQQQAAQQPPSSQPPITDSNFDSTTNAPPTPSSITSTGSPVSHPPRIGYKFDNNILRKTVKLWCIDPGYAENVFGLINDWDVSEVTNMSSLFSACSYDDGPREAAKYFKVDLSKWNVQNVTNMSHRFNGAELFNQDLSSWNVKNVRNMKSLFDFANAFEGKGHSQWNVENVEDMESMFIGAWLFNEDISSWKVEKCENMYAMFCDAKSFNQDLSDWNVEKCKDMGNMFDGAKKFEGKGLSGWNVDNVENMSMMFTGCLTFNQDLSEWKGKIKKCEHMSGMFSICEKFEGKGLSEWDVKNVRNMEQMFRGAKRFDKDLLVENWNLNGKKISKI